MIQRIVSSALRMPFIVFAGAVLLIVMGLAAYRQLDIEGVPQPRTPAGRSTHAAARLER